MRNILILAILMAVSLTGFTQTEKVSAKDMDNWHFYGIGSKYGNG